MIAVVPRMKLESLRKHIWHDHPEVEVELVDDDEVIVLRGVIDDEEERAALTKLAKRVAPRVEDRLAVKGDWAEEHRALESEFGDAAARHATMSTRFDRIT